MASKPLEFHPQAEEEYLAALAWYGERSQAAAINFEGAVERAIEKIKQAPERWPIYVGKCRRYTLHQFPFGVVYCVLPSLIILLAVAHGHRRPGYWKHRL